MQVTIKDFEKLSEKETDIILLGYKGVCDCYNGLNFGMLSFLYKTPMHIIEKIKAYNSNYKNRPLQQITAITITPFKF